MNDTTTLPSGLANLAQVAVMTAAEWDQMEERSRLDEPEHDLRTAARARAELLTWLVDRLRADQPLLPLPESMFTGPDEEDLARAQAVLAARRRATADATLHGYGETERLPVDDVMPTRAYRSEASAARNGEATNG